METLEFFFSIGVFLHDHSRIAGLQGKGRALAGRFMQRVHPLRIGSSLTRTGNLWFLSEFANH